MNRPMDVPDQDDVPETDAVIEGGLEWMERTQSDKGSWEGDYGGPLFLLPLYVFTCYLVDDMPDEEICSEIERYLRNHQNQDGGWGLHVEAHSYVYTSVLNYVAMRLLGVESSDPDLTRCRQWFLPRGGAARAPQWGKFSLALLGLIPWKGVMPVPPELWLLPKGAPVYPGRLWCHARMVYLPMSWLCGVKPTPEADPLLDEIRTEITRRPIEDIDWESAASKTAPEDINTPLTSTYRVVNKVLQFYERHAIDSVRQKALDFALDQIRQEDENTSYICIGPINKLLNTLCWHYARPGGQEVQAHIERMPDYLWHADDGVKMQGYNNSELWDTAFAVQSIAATDREDEFSEMLQSAYDYIEANQVLEEVPEREEYFRERSTGGWPFSNREHGWPISDCTAEGLKASLMLEDQVDTPLPKWRREEAVEQILEMQNPDGGWPTYEKIRAPEWIEALNPSEVFYDIMVDYSFVECTSASLQALAAFRERHPDYAADRIDAAIDRGRDYILDDQREDGSWKGSWGICFTYGTWFGVWGLRAAGLDADHEAIQHACDFLESKQMDDGGWGEHSDSCVEKEYVPTDEGQAVMTSWALLALAKGGRRDSEAVRRGTAFLRDRQKEDGTWPDEHIAGVFNGTCAIHYDNYLKIFPVWALSVCR